MFIVPVKKRTMMQGQKVNAATLLGVPFYNVHRHQAGVFCCECGSVFLSVLNRVISGATKSCGCLQIKWAKSGKAGKRHGGRNDCLYTCWKSMKSRCYNKNHKSFKYYGGRSIVVCEEWQEYEQFKIWATSNGYSAGLTIDRIDTNGNYEPCNCRWTTSETQANNRRNNIVISAFGKTLTASNWAKQPECSVSYNTLMQRLRNGIHPETAITTTSSRGNNFSRIDALAAARKK